MSKYDILVEFEDSEGTTGGRHIFKNQNNKVVTMVLTAMDKGWAFGLYDENHQRIDFKPNEITKVLIRIR